MMSQMEYLRRMPPFRDVLRLMQSLAVNVTWGVQRVLA
jgi:hypothetical protein